MRCYCVVDVDNMQTLHSGLNVVVVVVVMVVIVINDGFVRVVAVVFSGGFDIQTFSSCQLTSECVSFFFRVLSFHDNENKIQRKLSF